jgi:hypothetical protein
MPLKHVIEGRTEGRIEVVRNYWITLRKRQDTVDLKRKH